MAGERRSIWGMMAGVALIVILVLAGWTGWEWMQQVTVQEIRLRGHVNVTENEVFELIRTDTGAVLFDVNAAMLEDRVVRHPWIRQADVARLPSGVLDIVITERTPVALLMDEEGHAEWWVDAASWRLPITDAARYDVPLMFAPQEPWHPMRPLERESTRELVAAVAAASNRMDALFSEFVFEGGEWTMRLTPAPPHDGIRVLLGASGFAHNFERLLAFWDQEVLQHQNKIFDVIDLRFDSQIIAQERVRPGYEPAPTNNNDE